MTWSRLARLLIVIACLGVSGCANLPEDLAAGLGVDDTRDAQTLLERFDRLANQSIDDQKREFAAAQSAFDKNSSDTNRLRLVLALSLPQAPWRDDARVISLTAEWMADAAHPSMRRDVARLVYRLTVERQRQVNEELHRAETAQQAEQKRTDALLHDEHKKVEDLQQKLEALREIDRTTLKPPRKP
jgi:hypothetical protein